MTTSDADQPGPDQIAARIRLEHSMAISPDVATSLASEVATADPEVLLTVEGRDLVNGLPRTVEVHAADLR